MSDVKEAIVEQLPSLKQHLENALSPHVKSRYLVDDIVNDTIVRAFESLETFEYRSPSALTGWLQRIASRLVIDNIRRKQSQQVNGAAGSQIYQALTKCGELTPSRECSLREGTELVAKAMAALAEHHRRVIELRYLEGLEFAAIGSALGRSPEAARGLHRNALKALRDELGRASLYYSG